MLDYMYTSHLELNHENVQALLDIGQYLQVANIVTMCTSFPKACSSTHAPPFPMPGPLAQEQECMLSANLPPEVDLVPPQTQKPLNFASEEHQSKKYSYIEENMTIDMVTSMSTAPIKQLSHGYKLRNFYSKQYFKQSAVQTCYSPCMQGQDQAPAERTFAAEGTDHIVDQTPACQASGITVDQDPSILPPQESISTAPNDIHLTACKSPVSKSMRSRKAVYLKKYNYLCSEGIVVKMQISKSQFAEHCVNEGPVEEPEQSLDEQVGPENTEDSKSSASQKVPSAVSSVQICSWGSPGQSGNHYCCEICRKTFKHPSNLELHRRSHTGMYILQLFEVLINVVWQLILIVISDGTWVEDPVCEQTMLFDRVENPVLCKTSRTCLNCSQTVNILFAKKERKIYIYTSRTVVLVRGFTRRFLRGFSPG